MASLRCLTNSITPPTSKKFVKIVYPGGRIELHDRPILASEIMRRNPRCCVANPDVFRQPQSILAPETALALGRKFYVVPISTLRKLGRPSRRYCETSSVSSKGMTMRTRDSRSMVSSDDDKGGRRSGSASMLCGCFKPLDERVEQNIGQAAARMDERSRLKVMSGSPKLVLRRKNASPMGLACQWKPKLASISEE